MNFTIDELNSIKNLTDLLITDDCWTIFCRLQILLICRSLKIHFDVEFVHVGFSMTEFKLKW
jgi:hypothetical protein